ncbi:MAG TPA: helix-turn-helix transcriptional regulator [Pirellulales bacterium]|jgi:DNA-binding CsgD family transcriptional regulator|nr:helix-turn-helix transcriptional regulator [Pirellulales bacterium]
MISPRVKTAKPVLKTIPPLPLDAHHWVAVVAEMRLSSRQARIVELVLRDQTDKQIAQVMGIGEPTVKTYLARIAVRTGTRGRMQLAMRVLAVSHEVAGNRRCHPIG